MHGIHQSRGRIVFEVACAMALAASFAVAWTQTGASALLAAAAVAVLYSVVRTFDLRHVTRAVVPVVDEQPDLPVEIARIEAAPAEPVKAAAKPKRRSRKKPAESGPAPVQEVVATPVLDREPEAPAVVELVAGVPEVVEFEGEHHPAPVPLFEPEPFVRQQRTVFGRKSGRG